MNLPSNTNPLGVYQPLPPPGYVFLPDGIDFVMTSHDAWDTIDDKGAVFDTGLVLSAWMRLRIECQPYSCGGKYHRCSFGTQTETQNAFLGLWGGHLAWSYNEPASNQIPYTYGDKLLFEAEFGVENAVITANGQSTTMDYVPTSSDTSIYLGAANRTTTQWKNCGRPTPMRFWRLEYWKYGLKIADMLPVKNPATGDLQIWDACRKCFLTKLYGQLEEPTE